MAPEDYLLQLITGGFQLPVVYMDTPYTTEKEYQTHLASELSPCETEVWTETGRADIVTNSCVWEVKRYIFKLRDAIAAYSQAEEYKNHLNLDEVGVAAVYMSRECIDWLTEKGVRTTCYEIRDGLDLDPDRPFPIFQRMRKQFAEAYGANVGEYSQKSTRELGAEWGVSHATIAKWIKSEGLDCKAKEWKLRMAAQEMERPPLTPEEVTKWIEFNHYLLDDEQVVRIKLTLNSR